MSTHYFKQIYNIKVSNFQAKLIMFMAKIKACCVRKLMHTKQIINAVLVRSQRYKMKAQSTYTHIRNFISTYISL